MGRVRSVGLVGEFYLLYVCTATEARRAVCTTLNTEHPSFHWNTTLDSVRDRSTGIVPGIVQEALFRVITPGILTGQFHGNRHWTISGILISRDSPGHMFPEHILGRSGYLPSEYPGQIPMEYSVE